MEEEIIVSLHETISCKSSWKPYYRGMANNFIRAHETIWPQSEPCKFGLENEGGGKGGFESKLAK